MSAVSSVGYDANNNAAVCVFRFYNKSKYIHNKGPVTSSSTMKVNIYIFRAICLLVLYIYNKGVLIGKEYEHKRKFI